MANVQSLLPLPVTNSRSPNTFAHLSVPSQNVQIDLPLTGSESRGGLDDSTITGPAVTASSGR